jgi:hypothetical protein
MQILILQLDPLTEQQLLGIYNHQQSSEQAEALMNGMHQSLANIVDAAPNYMSLMAVALEELTSLKRFNQQVTTCYSPPPLPTHSLCPLTYYSYWIIIKKQFLPNNEHNEEKHLNIQVD